jgi:tetratricopeptide (TPR) repeat protein
VLATIFRFGLGGSVLVVRPAAASFFTEHDRVIISEFDNETDEPALGLAIREAIVTDLDQSPHVNVVERGALGDVLARMRLPDTTRLSVEVALEVARREGYPAVVTGGVTRLGTGYQLTTRILEAATGEVAVRLRETADDASDVLSAVEDLARLARRHLGESLLSIGRSQPLPEVTTASLEALELYAQAQEYADWGQYEAAIPLGEQAVRLDTTFATALRALGIWYTNVGEAGLAQSQVDRAHRSGERMLPRERYVVGATYNSFRGRYDSAEHYYRLALDRDPDLYVALNNLGDAYERMGRYEEALSLYRRAAATDPGIVGLVNLASGARTLGLHALADSTAAVMLERYPNTWLTWRVLGSNAYYAGDFAEAERVSREMAYSQWPFPQSHGRWLLASLRAMRGQLTAALALADSSAELAVASGSRTFTYWPLRVAVYAAQAGGAPERAQPHLEKIQDPATLEGVPRVEFGASGIIACGYVLAGDIQTASSLLASMDSLAAVSDFRPPGVGDRVRALIALAEGRPDESLLHLQEARAQGFGRLPHDTRLHLADTYAALGRLEEAAAQYDTLTRTYRLNFQDTGQFGPLLPLAHERLGGVYLALGDTVGAVRHLSAFTELWEKADPELQPRVEAARATLEQLVAEAPQ